MPKPRIKTQKSQAMPGAENELSGAIVVNPPPDDTSASTRVLRLPTNKNSKKKITSVAAVKLDPNVLPHGLGATADTTSLEITAYTEPGASLLRPPKKPDRSIKKDNDVPGVLHHAIVAEASQSASKKHKNYGVQLGVTPYPDLKRPTAEECQEVNRLLSGLHGKVQAPVNIDVPSRTVAGCGEVKFILEALIRTCLSAHTSMGNANQAIQGLLKRFSTLKDGLNAGSVDWNEVRLTDRTELEKAIRQGGMAPTKSKDIKSLLDMVYEENQVKRAEQKDKTSGKSAQDDLEFTKAGIMSHLASQILEEDDEILTLDYIHAMSDHDAFQKLLTYPGVGVKTAACTLLFCMQRPCFAVDTHVWRLCLWLGWVPEKATRDQTFAHCDVRVPNDLKYSLHQLFIVHGKTCGRCRAITREKSAGWEDECVLESLLTRTGPRKGGKAAPLAKAKKKTKVESDEEDRSAIKEDGRDFMAIAKSGNEIKVKPKADEGTESDEEARTSMKKNGVGTTPAARPGRKSKVKLTSGTESKQNHPATPTPPLPTKKETEAEIEGDHQTRKHAVQKHPPTAPPGAASSPTITTRASSRRRKAETEETTTTTTTEGAHMPQDKSGSQSGTTTKSNSSNKATNASRKRLKSK